VTNPTKKSDYLNTLRSLLAPLPSSEVEDILRDQEEFIRDAMAAGRSEEDAIKGLGDPRTFAHSLTANYKLEQAASAPTMKLKITGAFSAILAVLALAPLNLIFVLGPFLGAFCLLVGGWFAAGAFLLASVVGVVVFFVEMIFISVGLWTHLSAFLFILGCIGATLLSLLAMAKISQWFVLGTIAYLKWNLRFIQARA
jgi:uncharacterized membrane protein